MKNLRGSFPTLTAAIALVSTLCAAGAQQMVPGMNPSAPVRDIVALALSAESTTVHAGEPLRLRVQVVNHSVSPVAVIIFAPWDAVTLELRRDDGTVIKPDSPAAFGYHSLVHAHIAPGGILTLRWGSNEFNALSNWGYTKPLPAGNYTILAHPLRCCSGFASAAGQFRIDPSATSNTIKIRVLN